MDIAIASLAFVAAALCAGTMGFAIQRGGTCTVAAVDELVSERRATRLAALVEASAWVAGGLLVAQALHLLPAAPHGYAVSAATVVGGALLGLGAFVNRACVFGAVARFGSGEWAYVLTPIGFYVGCVSVAIVFPLAAPARLADTSPVLQSSLAGVLLFAAFVAWRVARPLLASAQERVAAPLPRRLRLAFATRVWSPHSATTVIGITFVLLFVLVGAWAYTDVLAEAAHGMAASLAARSALLAALLAGAVLGGLTAGRFRRTQVTARRLLRCFIGGVLMGWGSLLIPGGNDGLILVGMPLLWPYAWLAFLTMCVSIGAGMALGRRLGRHPAAHGAA